MGTKRLCYGVKTAPAQFQAAMLKILVGIDGVFCYIDDILIISNTVEQHLKILKAVFERLVKYNVKLNKIKCNFFQEKIQYLGHQLCAEGIRPLQNKVEAIVRAPRPKGVSELKSFLGMINFMSSLFPICLHDCILYMSCCTEMLLGQGILNVKRPFKGLKRCWWVISYWYIMTR